MTAPHFVTGLSFAPEKLEERRRTLGASEIAAVAGLDPHKSPLQVFLEKTGQVKPFEGNEFTYWGLKLESVIAERFAETRGVRLMQAEKVISSSEPWMSATPDRLVSPVVGEIALELTEYDGLEVKNKGARQITRWGESGTDLVPYEIATQCHWAMLVTGIRVWYVAALFGGNEFRWYRLDYNADIAEAMQEIGWNFWFNHVEKGIAPEIDGSESAANYLREKFRKHSEVLREATPDEDRMIWELRKVRGEIAELERHEATLQNRLKAAIGDDAGLLVALAV